MSLNESIVEDAALKWFLDLGYTVGQDLHLAPQGMAGFVLANGSMLLKSNMVSASRAWAAESGMALTIREGDYLKSPLTGKFDFAVLNPPYIRQEWILNKQVYKDIFSQRYVLKILGTSNLYVYFLVKAIADLCIGGKVPEPRSR